MSLRVLKNVGVIAFGTACAIIIPLGLFLMLMIGD